jgi:hypothetical protein
MTDRKVESGERQAESEKRIAECCSGWRILLKMPTVLWALGLVSLICYLAIAWLSRQFGQETLPVDRPTLHVLAWLGLAFACYWAGLVQVVRYPSSRRLLVGIFLWSALFRAVLLPSVPIHEIDVYRYMWDGAVLAEGISPYKFTPQQVREAVDEGAGSDSDLGRLVRMQQRSPSLAAALAQVHYGEYPSPYPMVSQAVFGLASRLTPDTASPGVRLVIMKELLVAFDLATLLVIVFLLGETGRNQAWCLAYGWSPLVLKEIAGSGHLDSIAIFLTTLALWLLVRTCRTLKESSSVRHFVGIVGVGCVLAFAVGAKLYPLVLVPLFGFVWCRRFGKVWACFGLTVVALVSSLLLRPLLLPIDDMTKEGGVTQATASPVGNFLKKDNLEETVSLAPPPLLSDPQAGIRAFLKHWEMNDLLFMLVLENLRPQAGVERSAQPWFVLMPDAWSRTIVGHWTKMVEWTHQVGIEVTNQWGRDGDKRDKHEETGLAVGKEPQSPQSLKDSSFMLTRVMLGLLVLWIAGGLAIKGTRVGQEPAAWCRAAMLSLAWFWLLCPTQNPWYWCWVVPLLPFVHYRAWHVVAACTMLYYLRFWLSAHFPEPPVAGTRYNGDNFFYYVIIWLEYLPCLLWLLMEWWADFRATKSECTSAR